MLLLPNVTIYQLPIYVFVHFFEEYHFLTQSSSVSSLILETPI